MKAYHNEIVNNVVSYIAKKYHDEKKRYIPQTLMYKIIALLDFRSLKQNGIPCLELTYTARERGPVPEELYKGDLSFYTSFKTDRRRKGDYTTVYYISTNEPNLDYIAPSERKILDSILQDVFSKNINGKIASDITHKEIRAWKIAREKQKDSVMSYEDEFEDLKKKNEDDMTIPELNFVKYMEFSNV